MNELTYKIRAGVFEVFTILGPGLLESVYENALAYELMSVGLEVKTQVPLPVQYKQVRMELGFRMDMIVNEVVVIEIKSVEALHDVHKKQVLTYLKLTGLKVGFLINFNTSFLRDKESIIRIVNNY